MCSSLLFGLERKAQKVYFQRREFSFTLQDDIYLRYQSFDEPSKFKDELVRRKPVKIDIGAVYNQIVNY